MPNGSIWLRYLCVLIASQVWTPLNGLIVFRKIGDAPVIYDESVALKSQEEIEKAVRNMGYMGATVHLDKNEEEQIEIGLPYSCRASL